MGTKTKNPASPCDAGTLEVRWFRKSRQTPFTGVQREPPRAGGVVGHRRVLRVAFFFVPKSRRAHAVSLRSNFILCL